MPSSRSHYAQVPQETAEEEMYAAFDGGDDDEDVVDDDDNHLNQSSRPLLSSSQRQNQSWDPLTSTSTDDLHQPSSLNNHNNNSPISTTTAPLIRHASSRSVSQPGTYDFEYDYAMLPPPGSPPRPSQLALPNAYGNSNGLLPSSPPVVPPATPSLLRRAVGAILPTHYARDRRGGGLGNDGVFGNVVAKPTGPSVPAGPADNHDPNGPYMIPEDAQKDAPPTYQAAQADSVPPYWENTILAPLGPFDGDMVIENLPVGSVFAFLWNLLVSVSFQFVGFLLTYLLHTSHASKYGSRAGLGITLIQYGFYMRTADAQVPIADDSPSIWGWPDPTFPSDGGAGEGSGTGGVVGRSIITGLAKRAFPLIGRAISVYSNGTMSTPPNVGGPKGPFTTSLESSGTPTTPTLPNSAQSMSAASLTTGDWLSFMLMTLGWFLLITSMLGFWRVKRWERGVQRSMAAQNNPAPEPTTEDLARNAQVLRNLEQAFGIQWDQSMSSPTPTNRVAPASQPSILVSRETTVHPGNAGRPRGDGGLIGLAGALAAASQARASEEANSETAPGTEERSTRRGTRRLFSRI